MKEHSKLHHTDFRRTSRPSASGSTSLTPGPALVNPPSSQAPQQQLQSLSFFAPTTSSSTSQGSSTSTKTAVSSTPLYSRASFPQIQSSITFIPSTSALTTSSSSTSISVSVPSSSASTASQQSLLSTAPLPNSNPPPRQNSKKNSKAFVPISPEQARIDFLQTELSGAQARIVQLDASIKDKDDRIAILMARIKILEDERTKQLFNNYFPEAANDGLPGAQQNSRPQRSFHACSDSRHSPGHHCNDCHPHHCCSHQRFHSQHCYNNCDTRYGLGSPAANEDFTSALSALQAQVIEIMEIIKQKKAADNNDEAKNSTPHPSSVSPSQASRTATAAAEPDIFATQNMNQDTSIASVEEFMNSNNLN